MKTCFYLQVYNENPTEVGVHGGGYHIYIYIFAFLKVSFGTKSGQPGDTFLFWEFGKCQAKHSDCLPNDKMNKGDQHMFWAILPHDDVIFPLFALLPSPCWRFIRVVRAQLWRQGQVQAQVIKGF